MKTWLLLLLYCFTAIPCQADASKPSELMRASQQELVGAWRLQSIELVGPNGATTDPFYGEGSSGILIYDASGWMSVQIVGAHRIAVDVPGARPSPNSTAEDERRTAAVLDTYYAYFATWDFDAAKSIVTHHVVASLFPSESGASYSQRVTLEGDHLIFTTDRQVAGSSVVQKKVWQRIKR
jgi:hypothetical protein